MRESIEIQRDLIEIGQETSVRVDADFAPSFPCYTSSSIVTPLAGVPSLVRSVGEINERTANHVHYQEMAVYPFGELSGDVTTGFDRVSVPAALSLPSGGSHTVTLTATPSSLVSYQTEFRVTSSGATATSPNQFPAAQAFQVNATGTGAGTVQVAAGDIPISTLQIKVRPPRTWNVHIIPVELVDHAGRTQTRFTYLGLGAIPIAGSLPNDTALINGVTEIYRRQTNAGINVTIGLLARFNYPTDGKEGRLNIFDAGWRTNFRSHYNSTSRPPDTHFVIYYVHRMPSTIHGIADIGWAVIDSEHKDSWKDAAHEIGHLRGLSHPFDTPTGDASLEKIPDDQSERLMGYGAGLRLLMIEADRINPF